jgi:NifU-like protein
MSSSPLAPARPLLEETPVSIPAAIADRLASLRHQGAISTEEASARGGRLVATEHGVPGHPDHVALSLLVSGQDLVLDAKVATAATGELLAAYDAMAELCIGRRLGDLAAVTPRAVEAHLRAGDSEPALTLTIEADQPFGVMRKAAERALNSAAKPAGVPAAADLPFAQCGLFEKVRRIEAVLDAYVRPALASDGGGIDLVDLRGDELLVQYHGACGSCSSSVGGTLQFVQDSLANHLAHPLTVQVVGMDEEPPFAV